MKKSEMLKQNTELFDRLTDAELTITALKKEIAERDSRITELKSEIERLNAKLNATEPLKTLEAKVVIYANNADLAAKVNEYADILSKVFIVSAVEVKQDGKGDFGSDYYADTLSYSVEKAAGQKCERCWMYSETVGESTEHPTLCARCVNVLK